MKAHEDRSTSDELARGRRGLIVFSVLSVASGTALSLWALTFDAPLLLTWLIAFIFGANVALVILTWCTEPKVDLREETQDD